MIELAELAVLRGLILSVWLFCRYGDVSASTSNWASKQFIAQVWQCWWCKGATDPASCCTVPWYTNHSTQL